MQNPLGPFWRGVTEYRHWPEFFSNVLLAILAISWVYLLWHVYPVSYIYLITEDHWAETGSFFAWAFAFGCLARLWVKDKASRKAGVFILGMGTFLCAMEEISWGQRIFQIPVPNFFRQYNMQSEFNLHNFTEIWRYYYHAATLLLVWCIVPTWLIHSSSVFRAWRDRWALPTVPLHLWPIFFLSIFFLYKWPFPRVEELAELFVGIAFAALSLELMLFSPWRIHERRTRLPVWTIIPAMVIALSLITTVTVMAFNTSGQGRFLLNQFASYHFPEEKMYDHSLAVCEHMRQHLNLIDQETYYHCALISFRTGRDKEAQFMLKQGLEQYRVMIRKKPRDPMPYRLMGNVLTRLQQHPEAEMAFQQAIELDRARLSEVRKTKKEGRIRFSMGKTLYLIGNRQAAKDEFSKVRAIADANTRRGMNKWLNHQRTLEDNFPVRD